LHEEIVNEMNNHKMQKRNIFFMPDILVMTIKFVFPLHHGQRVGVMS